MKSARYDLTSTLRVVCLRNNIVPNALVIKSNQLKRSSRKRVHCSCNLNAAVDVTSLGVFAHRPIHVSNACIAALIASLRLNTAEEVAIDRIQVVDFSESMIDSGGAYLLGRSLLPRLSQLRVVCLKGTPLRDEGVDLICRNISYQPCRLIDLTNVGVSTCNKLVAFARMINRSTTLEEIKIGNSSRTASHAKSADDEKIIFESILYIQRSIIDARSCVWDLDTDDLMSNSKCKHPNQLSQGAIVAKLWPAIRHSKSLRIFDMSGVPVHVSTLEAFCLANTREGSSNQETKWRKTIKMDFSATARDFPLSRVLYGRAQPLDRIASFIASPGGKQYSFHFQELMVE